MKSPLDERKSAACVPNQGAAVTRYDAVREILRDETARQAGFQAELIERFGGAHAPILFLSGEAHRRQRAATARFFAPKVVATRYRAVMVETSERLIVPLRPNAQIALDGLSLELAVSVAAEIVGLTDSDPTEMAGRLEKFFDMPMRPGSGLLANLPNFLRGQWRMAMFYLYDVRPAIRRRRHSPREDVISHLLAEGYSDRDILTECITYGAAGMATTREFITMAAWHLLERPDLRTRFLDGEEAERFAILEEILRLEPVIGTLRRKLPAAPSQAVALDIRAANGDEAAVGTCPYALDPDRERAPRVSPSGLAFGDGPHRCPGAGVALTETMIFLERLLRLPGLRLKGTPKLTWNDLTAGYELRDAVITYAAAETPR